MNFTRLFGCKLAKPQKQRGSYCFTFIVYRWAPPEGRGTDGTHISKIKQWKNFTGACWQPPRYFTMLPHGNRDCQTTTPVKWGSCKRSLTRSTPISNRRNKQNSTGQSGKTVPSISTSVTSGGQGLRGELKSDFGVSLSWGPTTCKKPLFGIMKFGLDWSWLDINYAKSSLEDFDEDTSETFQSDIRRIEFGMQVSPLVSINPGHHLKVRVYFRVTLSYSLLY